MPTNNANIGITYIDAATPPQTPSDNEVYFCKKSESIWVGNKQHSTGPLEHDITTYSFDDGIDSYFKKVLSTIVPVQAGSGTPSPTNIRDISGHTNCVVKNFSKNFMPQKDVSVPNTVTNRYVTLDLPKGTYTISAKVSSDTSDTNCRLSFRQGTTQIEATFIGISTVRTSVTVTLVEDCNRIYFYGGHSTTTYANTTYTDIQIERGSRATDYTPYVTPTTATISFGSAGTVYGGYVDLISGKLVVNRGYKEFDGSSDENISQYSGNRFIIGISDYTSPNTTTVDNISCNRMETISKNYQGSAYKISGSDTGTHAIMISLEVTTLADAKTWLSNNPIQVVYPLTTPQEYQLTPAQLRSLVGANRLTSNTGEVTEIEYIRNETISWVIDQIQDNSVEWTVIP